MDNLVVLNRTDLDRLIAKRPGEVKFGERVRVANSDNWLQEVQNTDAKFVLLGIPEDIGVRANHGIGGTHTFWKYALGAILNVQDTNLLKGEELFVLGAFDLQAQMEKSENVSIEKLRYLVGEVDNIVYPVIQKIVAAGKVPIIIGGGHNNAYPILKGASEGLKSPLNCINLDPHSDYRGMEGRHSGNGFRYAKREGYLEKYYALGLHENYNGQAIIEEQDDDPDLFFAFFEDIFVREKKTFYDAVRHAMNKTQGNPVGLELDMDCLERSLASAATASGITAIQARRFATWVAHTIHPAYFHIAEGAYELRDGKRDSLTPKMAAYLVTDFMKAYLEKRRMKLM
ncbi:MAG: formimidoylglutamase [Flavipsychrobacter sp.]